MSTPTRYHDPSRWTPPGVEWAHGTNTFAALARALASGVHFIEADVILCRVSQTPIMAHPPIVTSDLTLAAFLATTAEHNRTHPEDAVGIKLDFKDPKAVEPALTLVSQCAFWGQTTTRRHHRRRQSSGTDTEDTHACSDGVDNHPPVSAHPPVWLNADVLEGPGGHTPLFDAHHFVRVCQTHRPHDTLSLGWTVGPVHPFDLQHGYTDSHIDAMVALCGSNNLPRVTFAVHAFYAQQCADRIDRLLFHPGHTLTFWGAADETVQRWLASRDPVTTFQDTLTPGWGEWVGVQLGRAFGVLR
eukprot:m.213116 g.213116  ORF g.213116 m.213116 type:complete len:301 (-) comp26389_c0_seq1:101-1003(-)